MLKAPAVATGGVKEYLRHAMTMDVPSAVDLARKLTQAMEQNRLHRQLNALTQPKLFIIDEVGYLTLDQTQASLLFQVICKRYEREQSILLTSNKAFSDWGQVFADQVVAAAILDRLLHHATVVNIKGKSYRMRRHQAALEGGKEGRL